jgi:hypothetical protein
MPRPIKSSSELAVPDNVTVTIESRVVTVKGPRGSLTKSFQHLDVDLYLTEQEGAKKIMVSAACLISSASLPPNASEGRARAHPKTRRLGFGGSKHGVVRASRVRQARGMDGLDRGANIYQGHRSRAGGAVLLGSALMQKRRGVERRLRSNCRIAQNLFQLRDSGPVR